MNGQVELGTLNGAVKLGMP